MATIRYSAIVLSGVMLGCLAVPHAADGQTKRDGQEHPGTIPTVTLTVNPTRLTIGRQSRGGSFSVSASAGSGVHGTLAGTITVSQPANFGGLHLAEGLEANRFPFTISSAAGAAAVAGAYRISTGQQPAAGRLIYIVSLDPSCKFKVVGSPVVVTVDVE